MSHSSRARFWWGVSFLCNMVAVWFIQPLLVLLGVFGGISTPAALIQIEAQATSLSESATTMAEVVCIVAILVGIAAASRAASEAG